MTWPLVGISAFRVAVLSSLSSLAGRGGMSVTDRLKKTGETHALWATPAACKLRGRAFEMPGSEDMWTCGYGFHQVGREDFGNWKVYMGLEGLL